LETVGLILVMIDFREQITNVLVKGVNKVNPCFISWPGQSKEIKRM